MYSLYSYNDENYFEGNAQSDYHESPTHDYDPVALFSHTPAHVTSEFQLSGPISAPAVTQSTDDYFSLSFTEVADTEKFSDAEFVDHPPSVQTRQNTESYHRLQLPETAKQKRRTYSTNRIRNRSNLSHSFTNDNGQTNIFDEEQNRQPFADNAGKSQSHHKNDNKSFKENISAFRIDLDGFNVPISPLSKIKKVPHAFPSPQSEPGLFKANSRVDSFGSDVLLQHGHDGEVDHLHENMTCSLVPLPAEHDYFDYKNTDHSNGYKEHSIIGGFINVSGRVFEDPNNHGSETMHHENFLNYRESKHQVDNEKPYGSRDMSRSGSHGRESHENQGTQLLHSEFGELHNVAPHENRNDLNDEYDQGRHYHHDDNQIHNENMGQLRYGSTLDNNNHVNHRPNLHFSDSNYHQNHEYGEQHQDKQSHYQVHNVGLGGDFQEKQFMSSELNQKRYEQHLQNNDDHYSHYQPISPNYKEEETRGWEVHYHSREPETTERGKHASEDAKNHESDVPTQPDIASEDFTAKDPKKRKSSKVTICPVCGKQITRDYSRHIRIHDDAGRFQCIFPPGYCKHKSGKFNRPYDYKKHLLNVHFEFDDPSIKLAHTLAGKMDFEGKCSMCRQKFIGSDWLKKHILTDNEGEMCYELQRIRRSYQEEYVKGKGDADLKQSLYTPMEERGH